MTTAPQPLSPLVPTGRKLPRLVWYSILDDAYLIEVHRQDDPYKGTLHIFPAHESSAVPLHSEEVGLSYGAPFGPDSADVEDWQEIAEKFVEGRTS